MPTFPLLITLDGASLDVGVSAPAGYVTKATRPRTWKALVDTGATISVNSPTIVIALQPPQIGYVPITRAGGVRTSEPTYEVRVRLGGHRVPSRWFSLEVAELQPATP